MAENKCICELGFDLALRFSNLAAVLDGFCEVAEAVDPEAPYPQWLCAMLYHVRGFGEQLDDYMIAMERQLKAAGVRITPQEPNAGDDVDEGQDEAEELAEAVH